MDIVKLSENLHEIISKYSLQEEVSIITQNTNILSAKKIKNRLDEMKDKKRLIRIGIVGEVKTGKSSLINALLFKGKELLPKAITPETAALSVLEYDDELSIEVIFYTDDELDEIKKNYEEYEKRFDEYFQQDFQDFKEEALSYQSSLSDEELEDLKEDARSNAKQKLSQIITLSGSHTHYQELLKNIEHKPTTPTRTLKADLNELSKELKDYTSANGKYHSFVKEVKIKLPEKDLKDIIIVDTPGVDDPISSREQRTIDYLDNCDVVFMLSLSSGFFSQADLKFLNLIRKKNENREIYIISSKVDLIFSDDTFKGLKDINELELKLKQRQQKNDKIAKDNYAQSYKVEGVTENYSKNEVLLNSSLSASLLYALQGEKTLDNDDLHLQNQFKEYFPSFFTTTQNQLKVLELVSNINKLKKCLDDIKSKKEQLFLNEEKDFLSSNQKQMQELISKLKSNFLQNIQNIQTNTLENITQKEQFLEKSLKSAEISIKSFYEDFINNSKQGIKNDLQQSLSSYFKDAKSSIENSKEERQEIRTIERSEKYVSGGGGFWRTLGSLVGLCDRYDYDYHTYKESYTVNIITLKTNIILGCFDYLIKTLESFVNSKVKFLIEQNRQNFNDKIFEVIKNDFKADFDFVLLHKTIFKISNQIPYKNISYQNKIPKELNINTELQDEKVHEYIQKSKAFIQSLESLFLQDIEVYMSDFENSLKSIQISDEIFTNYKNELKFLKDQIQNSENSIKRFEQIISDLDKLEQK